MGTAAKSLVKGNVKKTIETLNKAFADEWLAYYQYWIGAQVVEGKLRPDVQKELMEHAGEELAHANLLALRIIQLGGKPILRPQDWFKMTNCGYEAPRSFASKEIVKQNLKGERCAIGIYYKVLEMTKNTDDVTYDLILQILKDEIEHEQDLEKILGDIEKNR